jgi:tetratricopeptide (TPR) repeat protein
VLAFYDAAKPIEVMPKAKNAAIEAVRMDESLAEGHASLGLLAGIWDFEWIQSERELRQAIELNPNYASAHHWIAALLSALGRHEEAEQEIRTALQLDPLSPGILSDNVNLMIRSRRYDAALARALALLDRGADFATVGHTALGRAYLAKGMYTQAVSSLLAARATPLLGYACALAGNRTEAMAILGRLTNAFARGIVHLGLGEFSQALDGLEQAANDRYPHIAYVAVEPMFDPIRSHPRFQELVSRVKLG